jgi:hypothetical protein
MKQKKTKEKENALFNAKPKRDLQIGYSFLCGLLTFSFSMLAMVLLLKPPAGTGIMYGIIVGFCAFAFGFCAYAASWYKIDWHQIPGHKTIIAVGVGE